jgi:hypothetical protein
MLYTIGKACALDIESNRLLEDSIDFKQGFPLKLKSDSALWCITVVDIDTGESFEIKHESVVVTKQWLKDILTRFDTIITHNGIKFDLPTLFLFGVLEYTVGYLYEKDTIFGKECNFIDTLILSRILNPSRLNGHGLEAWGIFLGDNKINYRQRLIDLGALDKHAAPQAEFQFYHPEMMIYCEQDSSLTGKVFRKCWKQLEDYEHQAVKLEHKLADLAINREMFGFDFDSKFAKECVQDLDNKLQELREKVNPLLPPKPFTKSELNEFTPPKNQLKKDGSLSSHMINFIKHYQLEIYSYTDTKKTVFKFEETEFEIGYQDSLRTHRPGDINDINHVKGYLIELGWIPTEWKLRDLTKSADKKSLPFDKRVAAFQRYLKETYAGKYQKFRCTELGIKDPTDRDEYKRVYAELYPKLKEEFPVRVITSPATKVGVSKELCPNLLFLGETVEFAKDFALYTTYKHRRSCIADKTYIVEDSDDIVPQKGYLNAVREDGRISTPAIEIGATSNRYKHSVVANIPRASSIYGKEMRSLFRSGSEYYQIGFDFSSLENRVQGGYVMSYPNGPELAVTLLAEKPFDLHSIVGVKLGISRTDAKSFNYAVLYGAFINKLAAMLNKSFDEAKILYEEFWNSVPALKALKEDLTKEWIRNDKKYITGIDGRRIYTRSEHSLLNYLFQSGGVIAAKYVTVFIFEELQSQGYCISPFKGIPDVCSMIEYHDENQLAVRKALRVLRLTSFKTEEEAQEYKKNYTGDQLSNIKVFSDPSKGFYICEPNPVSLAIKKATDRTEKLLSLKFELGFEWDLGKNWFQCH